MGEDDNRTEDQFSVVADLPPSFEDDGDGTAEELDTAAEDEASTDDSDGGDEEIAGGDDSPEPQAAANVDSTPDKKVEKMGYELGNIRRENAELKASLSEITATLKELRAGTKPSDTSTDDEDDDGPTLADDDVLTYGELKALEKKRAKQNNSELTEAQIEKIVNKRLETQERQASERQTWINSFPETHKELHGLGVNADDFLKRYQEDVSVLDGVNLSPEELQNRVAIIYKRSVQQALLEAKAAKASGKVPASASRKSTRGTGQMTTGASTVSPAGIKRDRNGLPMMFTQDD